jgi:hypothetical protein
MKYLKNRTPQNFKFLPDSNKKNIYKPAKTSIIKQILQWILGIFFFLGAISAIQHPLLLLIFGFIGFIIIPPGRNFLERKLRVRLNRKVRATVVILLFIAAMPLSNHYTKIDEQKAIVQKPVDEKQPIKKTTNSNDVKHEQQRKDSLEFHLKRSDELLQKHKINDAEEQLKLATSFANTADEHKQVQAKQIASEIVRIKDLMKARKYAAALPIINNILINDPYNPMLLLNRAICYSKTGDTQKAVEDLKPLLASGNTDAEKLNDKINPIQKKIIGYETLCNDGTTSDAKGRGACSHHGGVQDWNHPIYEESRKYE